MTPCDLTYSDGHGFGVVHDSAFLVEGDVTGVEDDVTAVDTAGERFVGKQRTDVTVGFLATARRRERWVGGGGEGGRSERGGGCRLAQDPAVLEVPSQITENLFSLYVL